MHCTHKDLAGVSSLSHTHTHVRRNIKNTHTSLTPQLKSGWGYCKKNITAPQKLHKNFIQRLPSGLQTDPCEVPLMVINRMLSLRDGPMKTAFFPSNLPSNQAGHTTAAATPLPPSPPPRSAAGGTGEECEGSAPLSAGVSCLGKHAGEAQPGSGLQGIYRAHRSASSFNSASTWGGGLCLGQTRIRRGSGLGKTRVRPRSGLGQTWVTPG